MRKQKPERLNANKYIRAYLVVMMGQLGRIEAKLDMLQHDFCGKDPTLILPFLDPKRQRVSSNLGDFRTNEAASELAALIGEIDKEPRKKKSKKRQ